MIPETMTNSFPLEKNKSRLANKTKLNYTQKQKIPDEILRGDARSPDCSSYESAPCYVDTPEESNIQATNCHKIPDLHHIVICG